mmetsp:Transcript_22094/g.32512  ORF Transcript_22094/g.32512 Transcript_22094/m.32512 type:complete len:435 (+) Transcript_22094:58-1362(+)
MTKNAQCQEREDDKNNEGIFLINLEQKEDILSQPTAERKSSSFASSEVANKIKEFYDTEGYVLIRGLIDHATLRRLQLAGNKVIEEGPTLHSFTSVRFGAIFSCSEEDDDKLMTSFREVALNSAVPAFISRVLLKLGEEGNTTVDDGSTKSAEITSSNCSSIQNKNLRVLNDVFLAKTGMEGSACGWHVDDVGFWPCSAHQDPRVPVGVNAWIAIDDIPSKTYGCGMAIVPKSHLKDCEWRQRGYDAIGSTKNHPMEGYPSLAEMAAKNPPNTCDLANISPELNEHLEKIKRVFNYEQGDVLLMSRWLWHRSMQANEDILNKTLNNNDEKRDKLPFKRYTIRYECGNTRLLNGASFHNSILYDSSNTGKTLNHVCSSSGLPFFPQAWPCTLESESSQMKKLAKDVFPEIESKRKELMAGFFAAMKAAEESKKEY